MATRDALLTLFVISILTFCIGLGMEYSISIPVITGFAIGEGNNFSVNDTESLGLNVSLNETASQVNASENNISEEIIKTQPETVEIPSKEPSESLAEVEPAVIDTLEKQDEAKVIIMYEKPEDLILANAPAGEQEETNYSEISGNAEVPELNITYDYETIDAVAATITKEQLEVLQQNPDIEIYEDKPFQVSLSQSVPFIDAMQVWPVQINGVNITGKDYTVCIVDTGVNASHPALAGRIVDQYDFCADNTACSTNDTTAEDLSGHGTHVAGIVASNDTTYRGVAPGANLAIMKAANSAGTLFISTITAGIEQCVADKDTYNISVISMSFGDGGHWSSSNCPSYPTIDAALDAAHDAGIFIAAASGNGYQSTGINYPACHSGVTSVGSVDRASDTIQSYSDSGSALDLLAPGGSAGNQITSTSYDGVNFVGMYGTSMATPHVAGLAILVAQYNKLRNGKTMTPAEIESKMKATGVNITDARNGLVFARINASAAIAPLITINYPANASYHSGNLDFNMTVDSNITSANVTINGTDTYVLTNDSSSHWYNVTVPLLGTGNYSATFIAISDINASKTVFFSVDVTPPQIVLESPANNSNISREDILDFTITDDIAVGTVLVEYNNANITLASPYDYNTTNFSRGVKNITVYANDTAGNMNSSFFSFNVSNSAPVFQSGQPNSTYAMLITRPLNITANATDPDGDSFNYSITTNVTSNWTNTTSGGAVTWNWTPNSTEAGNYYVRFNASDGINYTLSNVSVTVRNNTAPSLSSISDQTATVGTSKTIYFYASVPDLNYGDSLSWGDNTTLFSVTVINSTAARATFTPGSSSTGTYNVKITITDAVGESTYGTFKLTISGSSGSGNSGSSGNEGTSEIVYDNEKVFSYIAQDTPVSFAPDVSGLAVDNIVLETNIPVTGVALKIREVSSASTDAPGTVLDYFELVASGLSNSDITGITIQFEVPKSWLTQHEFNKSDVYLGHQTGSTWSKVKPVIASEDSTSVHYNATVTSLSAFAIAAKKEETAATVETSTQTNQTTGAEQILVGENEITLIITIAIICSVLAAVFFLILKRGLKPKPGKPLSTGLLPPTPPKKIQIGRIPDTPDFGFGG